MLMSWKITRTSCVLSFLVLSPLAYAADGDLPDPLFQSDEVLDIQIIAPIATLMKERPNDEYLPATVAWAEPDGRSLQVNVKLRARGNYRRRRDTCELPPVRLNFKTSEVKNTLFHKQDGLKLVTHCKHGNERYEQGVIREYLVYRMMNALTDLSYRVRLLRIRYTDTESDRDDRVTYGFVIEHKDRLAKRKGLKPLEVPRTSYKSLDPEYAVLLAMFQYMIGNTDYSPVAGAADDNCCHNVNLFVDDSEVVYPVPYDFDITGMVNTPYATPNPKFGLRSVKQRLFRGHCMHNEHLPAALQRLQDQRSTFYSLVSEQQQLTPRSAKTMSKFLDTYFKIADDRRSVDKKIIRDCRGES